MVDISYAASLVTLTGKLTCNVDTASTVQAGMTACKALGSAAVGVLVRHPQTNKLDLLAASSHTMEILELQQSMSEEGPCIDVLQSGSIVSAFGSDTLVERWPNTGSSIVDAGFLSVMALPMKWHGETFGGLNLFFQSAEVVSEEVQTAAQGVADILTLAVLHAGDTPSAAQLHVALRLQIALDQRIIVERAKGVISEQESVPQDAAYDRLVAVAEAEDISLTELAKNAILQAERGKTWNLIE